MDFGTKGMQAWGSTDGDAGALMPVGKQGVSSAPSGRWQYGMCGCREQC